MDMEYRFHRLTNEIKEYFIKQGVGQAEVPQVLGYKSGKVIWSDNPPSQFKAVITKTSCAFCRKLNSLVEVERIEVFPNESDDPDVTIIFKEKSPLSCIVFSEKLAWIDIDFKETSLSIPFCYELQTETEVADVNANGFHYSIYQEYGTKGMQKLFEDILCFVENVVKQKVYIAYLWSLKSIFNRSALFEKCCVYFAPDEIIAFSKKWKSGYIKKAGLKTALIGSDLK